MKRGFLAWLAVFIAWSVLDLLGHGVALGSLYAQHPGVFRPQTEMNVALIYLGVATTAAAFVGIYARLIATKNVPTGLRYGLLFGIGFGASIGCGGYAVHPIQPALAIGWFVLTVIECIVAGWLVGQIVRT